MPKVSVILPTYNGEKYIKEAIDSIINQTFTDWELIVVNDCSTDSTITIINEYERKDSRIKVINNPYNQKLPKSLNIGFSSAEGEYLTWTSDDNIFLPSALDEMNSFLDQNPNKIMVRARYTIIDENGNYLYEPDGYDSETVFVNNCIGACFLYRRDVLSKVGEYNAEKYLVEDYDYWLRILFEYKEIGSLDAVIYKYRIHCSSLTATRKKEIHNKLLKLRMEYINHIIENLENRKDLLCEIYYEFKQANMLSENLNMIFHDIIPELNFDCEVIENRSSIVYGAGLYGEKAYKKYAEIISYFADKNKYGSLIHNRAIISLTELQKIYNDYQILVAASPHNVYSFLCTLNQINIRKCTVLIFDNE